MEEATIVKRSPYFSHFFNRVTCIMLFTSHQLASFTFLASAVTPGYSVTSEDFELGITDEKDMWHLSFWM